MSSSSSLFFFFLLLRPSFVSHAALFANAWRTPPTASSVHRSEGESVLGVGVDVGGPFRPTTKVTPPPTTTRTRTRLLTASSPFFETRSASSRAKKGTTASPSHRRRTSRSFLMAVGETAVRDLAGGDEGNFRWTLATIVRALVVFVLSGVAEIGGGWLVWKAVREGKPWWWALAGSLVLVLYGFLPTLQPTDSFGRIYAVYGGFFIALSYVWGMIFDGMRPDAGDVLGGSLALVAVLVILFWPRQQ